MRRSFFSRPTQCSSARGTRRAVVRSPLLPPSFHLTAMVSPLVHSLQPAHLSHWQTSVSSSSPPPSPLIRYCYHRAKRGASCASTTLSAHHLPPAPCDAMRYDVMYLSWQPRTNSIMEPDTVPSKGKQKLAAELAAATKVPPASERSIQLPGRSGPRTSSASTPRRPTTRTMGFFSARMMCEDAQVRSRSLKTTQ
jgi:hypothetical protein